LSAMVRLGWKVFQIRSHEALFGHRVAKTHRMPGLLISFSAKEPYN